MPYTNTLVFIFSCIYIQTSINTPQTNWEPVGVAAGSLLPHSLSHRIQDGKTFLTPEQISLNFFSLSLSLFFFSPRHTLKSFPYWNENKASQICMCVVDLCWRNSAVFTKPWDIRGSNSCSDIKNSSSYNNKKS